MNVDFGLGLLHGPLRPPNSGWLADLDAALPALRPRFRSLWMTDHFFWDGAPTFEAWTTLSFLAGRFPEYEVGPMVLGQNYRNPALLALMASTLQTLSGGRALMGIGAGWKEDEYRAYGYDFPPVGQRMEQLEDALIILRRLWQEDGPVDYDGKHYALANAWSEPRPEPAIPIMVGGGGRRTMRLAAKYADWWNLPDADLPRYRERLQILHQHCDELGRERDSIRATWFGRLAIGKTQEEAAARAATREIQYTRANAFVGTPASIAADMRAFIDAGCSYFMVDIIGLPEEAVIRLVIDELIPEVLA
ncbi:MAG: LLM class flavin-dependent oxidoreductase [Anaerolineaceae bacterium]|nr:LLM class flavin-dependent oxidoreductase [Anaerolineaceae bacterium]